MSEPRTARGRLLLNDLQANLPQSWLTPFREEQIMLSILAIEAEAAEQGVADGRLVEQHSALADRLKKPEGAALPAALDVLEIAERYHSGHSVTGTACRCDLCRDLEKVRAAYTAQRSDPQP